MQNIMEMLCKMLVFKGSRISKDFDIFRYILISLTYFGHNLGTTIREGKGSKSGEMPSSFCFGNRTTVLCLAREE